MLDRCTLQFTYTQSFSGDVRMKQQDIIDQEAGVILVVLVSVEGRKKRGVLGRPGWGAPAC